MVDKPSYSELEQRIEELEKRLTACQQGTIISNPGPSESEELFRTTVEAMNEGFVITDAHFNPIYINPMLYEMTGYDKGDRSFMNFKKFYTEESQVKMQGALDENIKSGNGVSLEVQVNRKDGTLIDVLLSGNLLMRNGKLFKTVATFTDISKIKNLEKEHEGIIAQLEEALNSIRTLSGLVPICANCKKIRDDQGYWNRLESYIERHSDAQFSHGLCEDCAEDLYGNKEWFKKRRK